MGITVVELGAFFRAWLMLVLTVSHRSSRQHRLIKRGFVTCVSELRGPGQPAARFQSAVSWSSPVPPVCCRAHPAVIKGRAERCKYHFFS